MSPENKKASDIQSLRFLWPYVRPYRLPLAGAVAALALTAAAVLLVGQAVRYMVDSGLRQGEVALLNHAYFALLAVTALLAAASYARYFLVARLGERVVADVRSALFSRLLSMDMAFFETTRTGELLSRLTADTTLLHTVMTMSGAFLIRNTLTALGGFALLIATSPLLTLYVVITLVITLSPMLLLGRKVRGLSRLAQAKVAEVSVEAEEQLSGIRAVQALGLEQQAQARFQDSVQAALEGALSRIRLRSFLIALIIFLAFGGVVTVLWIGGHDVLSGRMSPGALSAFVLYAVMVATAVAGIGDGVADLQRAAGAAERISQLLALAPTLTSPENPLPLPDVSRGAALAFEQVSFRYPSRRENAAVEECSLTLAPGEKVALVGPSGAGKTTLMQLLLRFYDPTNGRITLNGVDIKQLDLREYRRLIGLVPQDPVIFSADALTNIRYGRLDASEEEVREAARQAAILEFLESLPQGLRTPLGEKGVQLSGGQKQRIAIARVMLRNPAILLLDEATSALDAQNEHLVHQALTRLMQGRTSLIIAHRLSTVLHADRIILMDNGRIQASGKHQELVNTNPLYNRLAALQLHA